MTCPNPYFTLSHEMSSLKDSPSPFKKGPEPLHHRSYKKHRHQTSKSANPPPLLTLFVCPPFTSTMAPQSPITRYLHCPTPSRAGPNSPVWNYIPRMRRLPGTGDTQFLLLREGVESPPDWFIKGGVPQNLVEEYNHMASSGQASFTEELIQAWDALPLRHLQFRRLPNDLPTHIHQLQKDTELILPSSVHHAEVISARGFGQLRITAEQLIMSGQPAYRLSVATFDTLDQS